LGQPRRAASLNAATIAWIDPVPLPDYDLSLDSNHPVIGIREIAGMECLLRQVRAIWREERAISSVEYAMLLAFVAAGIIAAADTLSNAIANEFLEATIVLDGDGCGNDGGGDGTGGDSGSGQGGANTC
jgi:Flp pilus assembly pilin Flp